MMITRRRHKSRFSTEERMAVRKIVPKIRNRVIDKSALGTRGNNATAITDACSIVTNTSRGALGKYDVPRTARNASQIRSFPRAKYTHDNDRPLDPRQVIITGIATAHPAQSWIPSVRRSLLRSGNNGTPTSSCNSNRMQITVHRRSTDTACIVSIHSPPTSYFHPYLFYTCVPQQPPPDR